MDKIDLILAELSPLMGKDDAESVKRKKELFAWFKEHNTEENKAKVQLFFDKEMKEMAKGIEDLRKQIDAEKYKILPLSYIAKNYFGKSSSWLLQRINGYKVRGKTYSLTDEQKNIFNNAVKEVAEKNKFGQIGMAFTLQKRNNVFTHSPLDRNFSIQRDLWYL